MKVELYRENMLSGRRVKKGHEGPCHGLMIVKLSIGDVGSSEPEQRSKDELFSQ